MLKQINLFSFSKRAFTTLTCFLIIISAARSVTKENNPSDKNSLQSFKQTGMLFTQNKGQIVDADKQQRPDILFKTGCSGTDIYLRKTGISYVLNNLGVTLQDIEVQIEGLTKGQKLSGAELENAKKELLARQILKEQRVDVDFLNCNADAEIFPLKQAKGYSNFFYGHCPQGITHVNSYNEVLQKNIYSNIDLKYYGSAPLSTSTSSDKQGLKYDIIVNPGGNPDQIKLKYKGADYLNVANGKLYIGSVLGEMEESLPKVYQTINGKIVDVKAQYILTNSSSAQSGSDEKEVLVSFELGTYDHSAPLIIDPFTWATYFGGSNSELSHGLTVDGSGNAIITGIVTGLAFPVTTGAVQPNYGGGGAFGAALIIFPGDAFVTKFDSNGGLLWATYYGGSKDDYAYDIASDPSGNVLITGITNSIDFPVKSAFQSAYGGGPCDAFIVKFDPTGSLLWSSYYGGSASEQFLNCPGGAGIASDASGNVLVTGGTRSKNFPIKNAAQPALKTGGWDSTDIYVAKFDPSGNQLWSTYYGGTGRDAGYCIAADAAGNVLVTGEASSSDFPTTAGVFQPVSGYTGAYSPRSACVLKFNSVGQLQWSSYCGGTTGDVYGLGIVADGLNNIIIVGETDADDFPVSVGCYQKKWGGNSSWSRGDGFVFKFNPNGGRVWSTYYGTNDDDYLTSVVVDEKNNIYVLGEWEDEFGYFTTPTCATQKTVGGAEDQLVAKFGSDGHLICNTFVGGSGDEDLEESTNPLGSGGIGYYKNYIYTTATNGGAGFPVTAGAAQFNQGGGSDAVVDKFCATSCGDDNSATVSFTSSPSTLCVNSAIQFNSSLISNLPCDSTTYTYFWTFAGGTPATSTQQNPIGIVFTGTGSHDVKLVVTRACGKDSVTQTISTNNCGTCTLSTLATPGTNVTCNGGNDGSANVTLSSGSGGTYTYSWSSASGNGASGTTTSSSIPLTGLTADSYSVVITDGTCSSVATFTITEPAGITATIKPTNANCGGSSGSATVTATGGTAPLTYSWSVATGASGQTATGLGAGTYSVTINDSKGCTKSISTAIVAGQVADTLSTSKKDILCNGANNGSASVVMTSGSTSCIYSWSPTGGTGQTASGLSAGTYSLTIKDTSSCSGTALKFNDPSFEGTPKLNSTPPSWNICEGSPDVYPTGTGAIAPSDGSTYMYIVQDCFAPAGTTGSFNEMFGQQLPVCLTAGVTYSFTVDLAQASAGGCYTALAIWGDSVSCGMKELLWSSAQFTNTSWQTDTVTFTPTHDWCYITFGPYYTTYCGGISGFMVDNLSDIKPTKNVIKKTFVINQPPVLTGSASGTSAACGKTNGSVSVTASGGTPGYSYSWTGGSSSQTVSGLSSGGYTVTVKDANGCSTTETTSITNTSGLTSAASVVNNIVCNGGKGDVDVTVTGGSASYTYSWSNGASSVTSGTQSTISNQQSGTYYVTITDANGCTSQSSIALTQPAPILVTAVGHSSSCGGTGGIANAVAGGGSASYFYTWSTGASAQTITGLAPGDYTVSVTDSKGCTSSSVATVISNGLPVASAATADSIITEGSTTLILGSGGSTYTWTPATTLNCSNCENPVASPSVTTTYKLYVSNSDGCIDSTYITIYVKKACSDESDVYIANVFSPNGDGKNDVLNIEGSGLTNIYWAIYDRWGNLIFDTSDPTQGWDGTKSGRAMETATYVYYVKGICKKTNTNVMLKGNVSLMK